MDNPKLKIILISTGQPSLNPRLVKEADTLAANGYDVSVLYSYWNDWGTEFDKILLPTKSWKAICVGGDPKHKTLPYYVSKLIHKVAKAVNNKTHGQRFSEFAIARTAYFMTRAAKKYKADLYIGHNLGALPATINAATKNKRLCGFDAEDFHRNEVSDDPNHPDVVLKAHLENKYFPKLDYLSTSSPAIALAYKEIFPQRDFAVILNVFPWISTIPELVANTNAPLRLLWFSQTIGKNRGLEDIVEALALLKKYPFELHLLGDLPEGNQANYIESLISGQNIDVHFHKPIHPDELPKFSSGFDIGLALEPGFSCNNSMALSNKIFTYLQGGLAVIASETKAQSWLISNYPQIGKLYRKGSAKHLAETLLFYHLHRDELFKTRVAAFEIGRVELNWENESEKFLSVIRQTLARHE